MSAEMKLNELILPKAICIIESAILSEVVEARCEFSTSQATMIIPCYDDKNHTGLIPQIEQKVKQRRGQLL